MPHSANIQIIACSPRAIHCMFSKRFVTVANYLIRNKNPTTIWALRCEIIVQIALAPNVRTGQSLPTSSSSSSIVGPNNNNTTVPTPKHKYISQARSCVVLFCIDRNGAFFCCVVCGCIAYIACSVVYIYNTSTSIYIQILQSSTLLPSSRYSIFLRRARNRTKFTMNPNLPKMERCFSACRARTFHQTSRSNIYPTNHTRTAVLEKRWIFVRHQTPKQQQQQQLHTHTNTVPHSTGAQNSSRTHKHTRTHTWLVCAAAVCAFVRLLLEVFLFVSLGGSLDGLSVLCVCVCVASVAFLYVCVCVFKTVLFLDSTRRLLQGLGYGNPVGSLARICIGLCMCKYV